MKQLSTESRIQLRDELINEFNKNKIKCIIRKNILKILNNNLELKEKYNLYIQQFKSEEEALYCLNHKDDISNHSCFICGNPCMFYIGVRHHYEYRNTCGSKECIKKVHQNEESNKKRKATKKDIYGDENYNNREKAAKTCEAKWGTGVTNPFQAEEVKQLIKEIHNEKRGFDYPTQDPTIVQKGKDTKLKRYGNENYNNRDKAKETCLKLYNDEYYNNREKAIETYQNIYGPNITNPFQDELIKEKIKNTCLRKYNKPFAAQVEKIIEKIRKTRIKNKGMDFIITNKEIQHLFYQVCQSDKASEIYGNDSNFKEFIKLLYTFKNKLLTFNELSAIFDLNPTTIGKRVHNLELEKYFDIKDSNLELQFKNFLINNNFKENENFTRHNHLLRTENNTLQEIDFLIGNIAFEINDIAGHSVIKQKDQYYHYNKIIMAKNQYNIRLIHLWEWELNETNWIKISQWIFHLLNPNKIQINSKDCVIKEIDKETVQNFTNEYNLYDYVESDVNLGLYYNNELIQMMSFKRQENDSYELLQFCTKYEFEIKNGAKELINHFIQQYNPSLITTIINLDKFGGATFEKLGFKLTEYKDPILLGDIGNKYRSIYNCGQNVYELKI